MRGMIGLGKGWRCERDSQGTEGKRGLRKNKEDISEILYGYPRKGKRGKSEVLFVYQDIFILVSYFLFFYIFHFFYFIFLDLQRQSPFRKEGRNGNGKKVKVLFYEGYVYIMVKNLSFAYLDKGYI